MPRKNTGKATGKGKPKEPVEVPPSDTAPAGRSSAVIDTRVIYCGDNLEQLKKLPNACVDLIYIDPPFNSNRNYEVFWSRPCDWHAAHYVKVMFDQIVGERCFEN